MAWSQVVEVEYPQVEDSEVSTNTEVGYNHNRYDLVGERGRGRGRGRGRKGEEEEK